jgi:hypothetical protein
MISLKLLGAALILSSIAAPASAQLSNPDAGEAENPNFSIYSSRGGGYYPPPTMSRRYNSNAMIDSRMSRRLYRTYRAPISQY